VTNIRECTDLFIFNELILFFKFISRAIGSLTAPDWWDRHSHHEEWKSSPRKHNICENAALAAVLAPGAKTTLYEERFYIILLATIKKLGAHLCKYQRRKRLPLLNVLISEGSMPMRCLARTMEETE
jgi:hypothetical protein